MRTGWAEAQARIEGGLGIPLRNIRDRDSTQVASEEGTSIEGIWKTVEYSIEFSTLNEDPPAPESGQV
jgi:hypothetical protein